MERISMINIGRSNSAPITGTQQVGERAFFTLKGAAPTCRQEIVKTSGPRISRKTNGRHKLLDDDFNRERMLLDRRTVVVPTFAMLDEEGHEYPEQTDQRWCFWDHYPIPWRPIGIPTKKLMIQGKPHYVCVRWTCSLECSQAAYHTLLHNKDGQFAKTHIYLDEMHRAILKHLGQPYTPLKDADDPNMLKLVGSGNTDINDFRSNCTTRYTKTCCVPIVRTVELYDRTPI